MVSKVLFNRSLVFSLLALSLASLLKSAVASEKKGGSLSGRSAYRNPCRNKTESPRDTPSLSSRNFVFPVHSRTNRYSCIPFRSM